MSLNLNKLSNFLDSEEGKKSIDDYFNDLKIKDEIKTKQLERFHYKITHDLKFPEFIEKVIAKYSSDKYKDSWYNRGIEPPEDLFWFLFYYSERYGRKCNKKEWKQYGNMFTSDLFFIHGYYFNKMNGQGSVIKVIKQSI